MTLASAGLMLRVAFGGGASLGFRWRWLAIAAEGRLLSTPAFTLAPDLSASAMLGMGILSACWHHPGELPLRLYSVDLCPLVGAGRMVLNVGPPVKTIQEHPFDMLVGLRWAASWQRWRGLYLKAFLEMDLNPLRMHVTYNGDTIFGDRVNAYLAGVLGFQVALVGAQPSTWFQRVPNPDEKE